MSSQSYQKRIVSTCGGLQRDELDRMLTRFRNLIEYEIREEYEPTKEDPPDEQDEDCEFKVDKMLIRYDIDINFYKSVSRLLISKENDYIKTLKFINLCRHFKVDNLHIDEIPQKVLFKLINMRDKNKLGISLSEDGEIVNITL